MTNRSAALRYARALLEVGIKERADLESIERELVAFATLMTEHPTLGKVLLNPAVSAPRKKTVVAEIAARMQNTAIVSKLLTLLAERDRLVLLPDLLASYRDRLLEYRDVVRAEVTTATPLADQQAAEIQRRLRSATRRTVTLQTRTDPSIIGGVVARIGSTVYDGSVTRQLQRMKSRLEGAGS